MPASKISGLVAGATVTDDVLLAIAALEADLERQTSLREALDRRIERARHDHEDDHERLLMRCRQFEDGEVRRVDAAARASEVRIAELEKDHRDALDRQLHESAQATAGRMEEAERRHRDAIAEREQALLRSHEIATEDLTRAHAAAIEELTRSHRAARDRAAEAQAFEIAERDDRVESLQNRLAKAEAEFRTEAYRLSASIALHAQDAQSARAEASALRERLAHPLASSTWTPAGPLRVLASVLRRAMRAPRRLARAVRSPR